MTIKNTRIALISLLLAVTMGGATAGDIFVICHPSMVKLDVLTVQRIFTGKTIEVGGVPVTAANLPPGSAARSRFLETILGQDEAKYTAYWTVRRFIGKGIPPRELPSGADIIVFVQSTPGAIGYIDEADLKPGLSVLIRK